ncbi:MAG: hypothetical protein V2A69_09825 [Pseudomonadota bacterium]
MKEKKDGKKVLTRDKGKKANNDGKKEWKRPTIEDVSGRVMAQPYIRFT